jgi:hypothetical protein
MDQNELEQQVWDRVWYQVEKKILDHISIHSRVSGAVLDSIVWYHRGDPLQQAWDRVRKQAEEDTDG